MIVLIGFYNIVNFYKYHPDKRGVSALEQRDQGIDM